MQSAKHSLRDCLTTSIYYTTSTEILHILIYATFTDWKPLIGIAEEKSILLERSKTLKKDLTLGKNYGMINALHWQT